ncbi:hypothetical protein EDD85DRAFT_164431 [Armillaria nabsnona]|nr:hypothetical protein EDD85DRAFT_164431 [Armillaria nabsnona]
MAEAKTTKEQLNVRIPLTKRARTRSTSITISHSGHSHLANAVPVLERVVFTNGVQWFRRCPLLPTLPRFSSAPCLLFDDLFVKKLDCDDIPPPPPRTAVPLTEQRFMQAEQCFDSDDDDDSLFFKLCPRRETSSIQCCQEQVDIDVQGARKIVMVLV